MSADSRDHRWTAYRAQAVRALSPDETQRLLRRPLALDPDAVLAVLAAARVAEPLGEGGYEGVEHLHANLCGASNSPGNLRSEHASVGLILTELATLYPSRYIFTPGDGIGLTLASMAAAAAPDWAGFSGALEGLAHMDPHQQAAGAVVAAMQLIGRRRASANARQEGREGEGDDRLAAVELSDSGRQLWSYALL